MEIRAASCLGAVLERLRAAEGRTESLRGLAEALAAELRCDRVVVWRAARVHREYAWAASAPHEHGHAGVVAADELPSADALARGKCVTLPGAAAGATLSPAAGSAFRSVVLLPVSHRGRREALVACGRARDAFDPAEAATYEQIAPHLGLVLHSWRVDEAQGKLRERRQVLGTLATDVLTAPDLESTAARLCELTRAQFGTTRSALFLLEDRDLVPIAAAGPYGDRAATGRLHVPPGIEPAFDEVLRTREVLVVNEFRSSPYAATPVPLPFRPQSATVIPLADASGVLGILTASELDDPLRFGPATAEDARILSIAATVALRRVLLVEELRRAGRAKDDFLATVSHELRTPLNVVLGYIQLLAENAFGTLTLEQAETVRRIEAGARGQLNLVNDLLDLAEVERGQLHCELSNVSLADLVADMHDLVDPLLAGRPISFEVELSGDLVAHTDRARVKQVLVNVLANAAKFTERGEIRLAVRACAEGVEVEVSDTGVGMEPGFLARATEPFVRGDSHARGSGLGLAIVSRVVRALGSEITIESRPAVGTRVRIVLPPARQDDARSLQS